VHCVTVDDVDRVDPGAVARDHRVAGLGEMRDEMAARESARAGDERLHAINSR
jgi:hypothetical protein